MKPKISIVVPIYNVETYLGRCLDSLLEQTFTDLEIIAVNDGSTDSSLQMVKEYADRDNRIVVVNKPNGGVSSARNEGLRIAQGEYIGFVDPDDWVDHEMYDGLYHTAIHDQADIVMCSYMSEFCNHSKRKKFHIPDKIHYSHKDVKTKMMRRLIGPLDEEVANPELLDAWGTVWSKLYKAELIKKNQLEFTDLQKIGTNEDSLFNIQAFYYAHSFVFINIPFYHYWRGNSTSVTSGYKPNLLEQWFRLYDIITGFLEEKNMDEPYHLALNNRICLNLLGLGLNTISKNNKSSILGKVRFLNRILSDHRIKRSFQQLEMSHFPIVWKVFYYCAKLRLSLGFYLMLVSVDTLRRTAR